MTGILIPEVYLKDTKNDKLIKYRLAYEWDDNAMLICIPKNGDEPYTIKIKIDEIEKSRYYR